MARKLMLNSFLQGFIESPAGRHGLLRELPSVLLVSGTNLPMLLDFVMSSAPSAHDAARTAVDRARSAIAAYGGPA